MVLINNYDYGYDNDNDNENMMAAPRAPIFFSF